MDTLFAYPDRRFDSAAFLSLASHLNTERNVLLLPEDSYIDG
jgi:hypothetical protein